MVKTQNKWKHGFKNLYIKKTFSYLLFSSCSCVSSAFLCAQGDIFYFSREKMIIKEECKLQTMLIRYWQHALSVHLILKLILGGEDSYFPHFIDTETEASTKWIRYFAQASGEAGFEPGRVGDPNVSPLSIQAERKICRISVLFKRRNYFRIK